MTDCPHSRIGLELAWREMTPEDRLRFKDHAKECEACETEVRQRERLTSLLARLPAHLPVPTVEPHLTDAEVALVALDGAGCHRIADRHLARCPYCLQLLSGAIQQIAEVEEAVGEVWRRRVPERTWRDHLERSLLVAFSRPTRATAFTVAVLLNALQCFSLAVPLTYAAQWVLDGATPGWWLLVHLSAGIPRMSALAATGVVAALGSGWLARRLYRFATTMRYSLAARR